MKLFRFCLLGVILVSLAGCFQVSTVVRVNPDGSGSVEERVLFSRKVMAQFEGLFQGLAAEGGEKPKPMELFEPDKLKLAAQEMGEGVTYRSGKKVVTDEYEGYQVEYAFTDINKLKLQQKTKPAMAAADGQEPAAPPLCFHFSKGKPATLTIRQQGGQAAAAPPPASPAAEPAPGGDAAADPQLKAMVEMLRGLRFNLAVEVNGTIASTNATHRDGTRLTLIDMDFEKLAGGMGQLASLGGANAGAMTMEQARSLFKEIPGVKVDMNEELTVVFQ